MHTLLDLKGNIPVFIYLTEASIHDVKALDELCVEVGAIYLMDMVLMTTITYSVSMSLNGIPVNRDNFLFQVQEQMFLMMIHKK